MFLLAWGPSPNFHRPLSAVSEADAPRTASALHRPPTLKLGARCQIEDWECRGTRRLLGHVWGTEPEQAEDTTTPMSRQGIVLEELASIVLRPRSVRAADIVNGIRLLPSLALDTV